MAKRVTTETSGVESGLSSISVLIVSSILPLHIVIATSLVYLRDMIENQSDSQDKWDPALYNKNGCFTYSDAYTTPVLGFLNAQKGEKILDVGCGTGELSLKLQEAVGEQGIVVGCDLSEKMV